MRTNCAPRHHVSEENWDSTKLRSLVVLLALPMKALASVSAEGLGPMTARWSGRLLHHAIRPHTNGAQDASSKLVHSHRPGLRSQFLLELGDARFIQVRMRAARRARMAAIIKDNAGTESTR
jgi:hypothetical protein